MSWFFPEERIAYGEKGYPTLCSVPEWDKIRTLPTPRIKLPILPTLELPPLPPRPASIQNLSVKVIGDYNEMGISRPRTRIDAPATLSYDKIHDYVSGIAPTTDPAVVDWMVEAGANDLVCEMVEEDYAKAGSSLLTKTDDPYIPGCMLEDIRFRQERGRVVTERGYSTIVTPRGNFSVPVPGKATGVFEDMLCWGCVTEAWMIQWVGVLLKWKELATNPQSRIRFPNFRGLVAPQFIAHEAEGPSPINFVTMRISTDKAQTIRVVYRELSDYTQQITNMDIALQKGQNEITYGIYVLPYVPKMAVQIQPEDNANTILDSYTATITPF